MDTKGLQKEFINWCKSKNKSPKSKDETEQLFVAFMKEKHPEEYKQAMENQKKQQQAQAQKAAHGAKLQYFRTLKNQCADDEELYYYKKGGSVGCGCKKKEDGGEVVKAGVGVTLAVQAFKGWRKRREQEKKKTGKTWGETSEVAGVDHPKGNGGLDAKVQDSAVPNEDVPSHDKSKKKKTLGIKMANDSLKCGGKAAEKFKAKCGSKIKKHQYGNPIYLTQSDYQGGINLLKRGANKIWDLMNYNITNNPNIITGAPDFLPGTGGGNIGKVVGQIRKIAPGVSKAKTTLKNGKIVNSLDKKVRMAKEADLRKEAGLSYWKNLAGRLEK